MSNIRGISTSEISRPAAIPVDLQQARLKLGEAIQLLGFCLLALVIAIIGISISLMARPEGAATWTGFRIWFFLFGSTVAVVCLSLAWIVLRLMRESWLAYHEWSWLYVEVDIAGRRAHMNQEKHTEVNAWELSLNTPRDVLLFVISLQAAYEAGNAAPHTVRTFTGERWLGDDRSASIRLGDVTSGRAEQFSKILGQLGLVRGREARRAGDWVPQSYDEAIRLVVQNWSKVRL